MLRSVGKTCFACAYTWNGALRRIAGPRTGAVSMPFVAGYHRVVESFERSRKTAIPSMLISAAMFERHIDWLAKRFALVSLDEIGLHLEQNRPSRRPMAAITFDDGYSDVYHHAFPLLRKKGIPAAVFVVTGIVGTGRPQIFDRFYLSLQRLHARGLRPARVVAEAFRSKGLDPEPIEYLAAADHEPFRLMTVALNAFPQEQLEAALDVLEEHVSLEKDLLAEMTPLSWDMIENMHRNGITIGSHTASHRLLPTEPIETARVDVLASKQTLEAKLGTAVKHFAYPDGRFNPAVVRAVNSAGYRYAYGICRERDPGFPLLTIPRKILWERSCVNALGRFSSSIMNCQTQWAFDRKGHCEHDHDGSIPTKE
jgi:peptidoglycan/xylan/chitin deacetylase (PgdA/CDA1 family)